MSLISTSEIVSLRSSFIDLRLRDDIYENIEVKYKMIQQKDDQVRRNERSIDVFATV